LAWRSLKDTADSPPNQNKVMAADRIEVTKTAKLMMTEILHSRVMTTVLMIYQETGQ